MSGNVIPPPSGYSPHARFALLAGYDGSDWRSIRVDSLGQLSISMADSYKASDIDTANDTKYYGFLHVDGVWYIMQEVTSTGAFRLSHGIQ